MNRYIELLTNKRFRFSVLSKYGLLNWMTDEAHIKENFRLEFGREIDLDNPKTFNEKLQWLKLNDRQPEYAQMVDKYESKKIVEKLVGSSYVIPVVGGPWNKFDEINFDELPEEFVLKTTHDCGGVYICKDKRKLNLSQVRKFINGHLNRNYYMTCREWPYKNVKPRIFAEKYMCDMGNEILPVYKVFTFNGEPRVIQLIINDKTKKETVDYFNTKWERLPFRQNFPNSKCDLKKPEKLDEILKLACRLNSSNPFLRTDFYVINGQVFFSEFTFYSDAGMAKFEPAEWDYILGEWIKLPEKE